MSAGTAAGRAASPPAARGSRGAGRPPRRRRVLGALAVVLAALVALWFAAAWYFSGVLYDDALRVSPPPAEPVPDVEVLGVAEGSVTLSAGDDEPTEVRAPGLWGLWWDGGYGRVTAVTASGEDEVTRAFSVVSGTPPAAGDLVDVDKYLYGDDPDDVLGLAWEDVRIPTELGEQDAWFVPAGGGDGAGTTWAILVHGKGADRDEMLRLLRPIHAQGLPALVITYRNDAGQPGDPSGVYRYGATEWADLDAAVDFAHVRGATGLVLAGSSTGAAIVGSWLDHTGLAPTAIVLDAPNADVERTFAYGAAQRTVPGTPLPLPPGLDQTAFRLAELRFPLDLDEVDYSDTLAAADVPMLVIHGAGDDTVPVDASRDLVAERSEAGLPTSYLETAAAEHVGSYNHDPAAYERAVDAFLAASLP
jgi:fermentation-respiration switch protein FrsA (DUF1100 family)